MKLFNYKDWWNWVFYISLIYCIFGLIFTANTWIRWKWGYFSIDSIPYFLILASIGYWNQIILNGRMLRRLEKLESSLLGTKVKQNDK